MMVIVTILVIFSGKKVTIMKHDTALKTVCGLCLMKPKAMENISEHYLNLIRKHHYVNYNLTSGDFPTVHCGNPGGHHPQHLWGGFGAILRVPGVFPEGN